MNKLKFLLIFICFPFAFFSQSIKSISPNTVTAGQTLNVTITGSRTNFTHPHFTQGSSSWGRFHPYFGSGSATEIVRNFHSVVNDTLVVFNISVPNDHPHGYVNLLMYDENWNSFGKKNAFFVNAPNSPQIVSVTPATVSAGQTLDVTITGVNTTFSQLAQASSTTLDVDNYFGFSQGSSTGIIENSKTIINDTSVIYNITIPNNFPHGNADVSMFDYPNWGNSFGKRNAIFVNSPNSPRIISVNPNSAKAGQTLDVTITGANTNFNQFIQQGSMTISNANLNITKPYFYQGSSTTTFINKNSYTIIDVNTVKYNLTIPSNYPSGPVDFSFYTSNGEYGMEDAFYINPTPAPKIVSINPSTVNAGQTLDVTITGSNTNFSQGSSTTLSFGFEQGSNTTIVNSYNIINDSTMTVNISVPSNVYSGPYDVYLNNYMDGTLHLFNGITVVGASCNISAGFTYNHTGSGSYTFTNTSTGNIVLQNWNFGDGIISNSANPNHTFLANGTYIVVLTVTDSLNKNGSCFDYIAVPIQVVDVVNPVLCNAAYSMFPDINTNSIYVINSSTGTNLSYFWDFGDGNYSSLAYPDYFYTSPGPFNLCLTIYNGNGCSDTYCDIIGNNGVVFKQMPFNINVIEPATFGINELDNSEIMEINAHPNPSNGKIEVDLHELKGQVKYELLDINGRVFDRGVFKTPKNQINIENLNSGTYFISVDGFKPFRIVKM